MSDIYVDLPSALDALGVVWENVTLDPFQDCYVVKTRGGTYRISCQDIEHRGVDVAAHDAFFCFGCDAAMPRDPLSRLQGADGRSRCWACASREPLTRGHGRVEPEPELDTDIRVGDVVEVVSLDNETMKVAAVAGTRWDCSVGYTGVVRYFGPSNACDWCVLVGADEAPVHAHGHFRILERGGHPYVRGQRVIGETSDGTPQYGPDVRGRSVSDRLDANGNPRETQAGAYAEILDLPRLHRDQFDAAVERLRSHMERFMNMPLPPFSLPGPKSPSAPVALPLDVEVTIGFAPPLPSDTATGAELDAMGEALSVRRLGETDAAYRYRIQRRERALRGDLTADDRTRGCAWCGKPEDIGLCLNCVPYQRALDERLDTGGTYDIDEERESIRRYVDAKREAERPRCKCGSDRTRFSDRCPDCIALSLKVHTVNLVTGKVLTNERVTKDPEIDPTGEWCAGAHAAYEWP